MTTLTGDSDAVDSPGLLLCSQPAAVPERSPATAAKNLPLRLTEVEPADELS